MRRILVMIALAAGALSATMLGTVSMAAPVSAQEDSTDQPAIPESPTALPRANSGRAPQQAGDRGGALQLALLVILVGGLTFIASVIVRSARRQNRALDATP
jgi:hypothetical protein